MINQILIRIIFEKSLVLTGMMGGKVFIGRLLAKKLRFKFIDVDRLIEEREKINRKFLMLMVKNILEK